MHADQHTQAGGVHEHQAAQLDHEVLPTPDEMITQRRTQLADRAEVERDASRCRPGAPAELRLLLDMRQSQNVLAWSLVRRSVACAGEFGHSFYLRFQAYSLLLFGGSCGFVGAMTFTSKSGGTMDTARAPPGCLRILSILHSKYSLCGAFV